MVSIYRPNSNISAFLMLFIFHCRIVHVLLFVKSLKKKDKIFLFHSHGDVTFSIFVEMFDTAES
jgi:hypothetical protein